MGRRTKYTPKVVDDICTAIRLGATYELAAAYAGITYETFRTWMNDNPAFSAAIHLAEGKGALTWLGRIEKASQDGIWQAAAWKLERRYPQDYGRTVQEHQGKDGGAIILGLVGVDLDEV